MKDLLATAQNYAAVPLTSDVQLKKACNFVSVDYFKINYLFIEPQTNISGKINKKHTTTEKENQAQDHFEFF